MHSRSSYRLKVYPDKSEVIIWRATHRKILRNRIRTYCKGLFVTSCTLPTRLFLGVERNMNEERIHVEEEMKEAAEGAKEKAQQWTEEISVAGGELMSTLSRLAREATVRKITVKNPAGKTVLNIPLAVGAAGVVVLGPWSVLGLVAAWLGRYSIIIEHVEVEEAAEKPVEDVALSA